MLADLGAEVIKVEPPDGDLTRFAAPRINGLAAYFVQQNAGKRNISLDLSKPGAAEILLGLAEHCDVLVENFRPGVDGAPRASATTSSQRATRGSCTRRSPGTAPPGRGSAAARTRPSSAPRPG